jgi:hypothetical protein
MKRSIAIVMLLVSVLCFSVTDAADATSTWNTYCGAFNFAPYPQTSGVTFAQAYSGSNLSSDLAAITALINSSLQTSGGPRSGNELLNASLENWN